MNDSGKENAFSNFNRDLAVVLDALPDKDAITADVSRVLDWATLNVLVSMENIEDKVGFIGTLGEVFGTIPVAISNGLLPDEVESIVRATVFSGMNVEERLVPGVDKFAFNVASLCKILKDHLKE